MLLSPCLACVPGASATDWSPTPVGTPCDDGLVCTALDACSNGQCAGIDVVCNDNNPCSTDVCDPAAGCLFANRAGACDDGDACTLGDTCVNGKCAGSAAAACDDANPCTDDACAAKQGCVFTNNADACTDNNPCTVGDGCQDGQCAPGAPDPCDDGDACTVDLCDPPSGCAHAELGAQACDDGNPCTDTACDPTTGGCVAVFNAAPCDDGDICTVGDGCQDGQCTPGAPDPCDDGYACTADTCTPGVGCVHQGNCCAPLGVPCPEGFGCTSAGTCENGAEVFVPGGSAWTGDDSQPAGPEILMSWNPMHEVILDSFAIDRTEVTVSAYAACVAAGVCAPPMTAPAVEASPIPLISTYYEAGMGDHPVVGITWDQATTYCQYRGKRLPTEAEWEVAARGGCAQLGPDCKAATPRFPWGDAPPDCNHTVFYSVDPPGAGCGEGGPQAVGTHPAGASIYGAQDMVGNAAEWVADWHHFDFYCQGPNAHCVDDDIFCPQCTITYPPKQIHAYAEPWANPVDLKPAVEHVVKGGNAYSVPSSYALDHELLTYHRRRPVTHLYNGYVDVELQPIGFGVRCARSLAPAGP